MDNIETKVVSLNAGQDILETIAGKTKRPTEEDLYNELNYYRATKLIDKMLEVGLITEEERKAIMRETRKIFPTMLNGIESDESMERGQKGTDDKNNPQELGKAAFSNINDEGIKPKWLGPKEADIEKLVPKVNYELPKIDLFPLRESIQPVMTSYQQDLISTPSVFEERRKFEERQIKAAEETAANTATTNERLNGIIDNQNEYIKLLKDQLHAQKQQIDTAKSQLQMLRNLFTSLEDGVSVEKELAGLIQSQIDENHPLWDYVKDKGGDIGVAGIVAGTPILYNALIAFLINNGIVLP